MEQLKHECGVAMIRLKQPLSYYEEKYGTWMWGLNKLYLLMEKQHNRGQEGAGLSVVRLNAEPGEEYMFRERAEGSGAITEIFSKVHSHYQGIAASTLHDIRNTASHLPFAGEVLMGHLRYSTTGKSGLSFVHPFLRRNNWRARNLALCGNFNMTNVADIMADITSTGQHPRAYADTFIILEQVGHRLDRESERLFNEAVEKGLRGTDITAYIERNINMANVLRTASGRWDGGYVICGQTGSGEMFALRDPWGIRPAYWYEDDEVIVLTSERPVIQTTFNVQADAIHELQRGQALMVSKGGELRLEQINQPQQDSACSFERIYFSRGSDMDIYRERKTLGRELVGKILQAVGNDTDHTVFSFIPNTAEVAFYGMMEGLNEHLNREKAQQISTLGQDMTPVQLQSILKRSIRQEKVAIKDIKLRTFITEAGSRNDLAAHVYDITYGTLRAGQDSLVVIDDSIVRGTTLRQSILSILSRLHPRKIVVVSSAPQIRYPDYYGIDMAHLSEFIIFQAAVALLQERGMQGVVARAYAEAKSMLAGTGKMRNVVKDLYEPFTAEELSAKAARLLTPPEVDIEVELVYQSIEGLHKACATSPGDWYFSGNYPTPGGLRMVNRAFVDYVERECPLQLD